MTERVLVPIDGSESSWAALEHAFEHHGDDPIVVLYVADPSERTYTDRSRGGEDEPDADESTAEYSVEYSKELFQTARERADTAGTDVETETTIGSPADAILEHTDDNEIDHIVMGSRGRSGLSRLLLGSVAETVVRRSSVPVTVARSPE
jgi:Universal stress protein UspA and related nucleotide-binding proteins